MEHHDGVGRITVRGSWRPNTLSKNNFLLWLVVRPYEGRDFFIWWQLVYASTLCPYKVPVVYDNARERFQISGSSRTS